MNKASIAGLIIAIAIGVPVLWSIAAAQNNLHAELDHPDRAPTREQADREHRDREPSRADRSDESADRDRHSDRAAQHGRDDHHGEHRAPSHHERHDAERRDGDRPRHDHEHHGHDDDGHAHDDHAHDSQAHAAHEHHGHEHAFHHDPAFLGRTATLEFKLETPDGAPTFPVSCAEATFSVRHEIREPNGDHGISIAGDVRRFDDQGRVLLQFEADMHHADHQEGVEGMFRAHGSAILAPGQSRKLATLGDAVLQVTLTFDD